MADTTKRNARRTSKGAPLLALKVSGPDIRSGRIPIPELLVICAQAQSAVDRQAEAMEGKRTLRPGPTSEKVRHECTLELVGLGKGSAVLSFEPAKPQTVFPGITTLGLEAVEKVGETIAALSRGETREFDPGVLDSLNKMGEVFEKRVRAIVWIVPRHGTHKQVRATYNHRVHTNVTARLKPATMRNTSVDGVLEMADFKATEHRCRIHPTLGAPINCTFNPLLADQVYESLRRPVRIHGTATINPETGRTEGIEIREVKPLDPLTVNAGNFFTGWTFDQLVMMQAARPIHDPRALAGGWPEDEDLDDVMADIYQHRR